MTRLGLRTALTVPVGLILCIALPGAQEPEQAPSPLVRLDEIRAQHPLKDVDSMSTVELMRGQGVSAHLIQVRTRVRPHYHRDHGETVYVLEGSGILILGDRVYPLKAGSLLMIPKGVIHSFDAKQPTTVLSVFDPPFDPADRIYIDEPAATP